MNSRQISNELKMKVLKFMEYMNLLENEGFINNDETL